MTALDTHAIASLLRQTLAEGQEPFVIITSDSMAPLFRPGDQARIEAIPWQSLRPGDILLVEAAADLLTHRLREIVTRQGVTYLRLRGDRPLDFDAPIPAEKLIGRATARRREGRLLPLRQGMGRWLNVHLAGINGCESRLFAHATSPLPRSSRLIRRAFYIWAKIIVAVVAVFGSKKIVKNNQRTTESRQPSTGNTLDPHDVS